jgi:multiple antibiotic resistance protein
VPVHALYSFVTLFVVVDPIGTATIFGGLTRGASDAFRRRMAYRGTVIASALLFGFAFLGTPLLTALGITLPALSIAGGILLFLLAVDMVFARPSGIRNPTRPEQKEAAQSADISVFPLAIPLLAGPGALTSVVLLMERAASPLEAAGVIAALLGVMLLTLAALLGVSSVMRLLGVTGANVVSRVLGIVLAALAAQLVLDGLTEAFVRG